MTIICIQNLVIHYDEQVRYTFSYLRCSLRCFLLRLQRSLLFHTSWNSWLMGISYIIIILIISWEGAPAIVKGIPGVVNGEAQGAPLDQDCDSKPSEIVIQSQNCTTCIMCKFLEVIRIILQPLSTVLYSSQLNQLTSKNVWNLCLYKPHNFVGLLKLVSVKIKYLSSNQCVMCWPPWYRLV